MVRLKYFSIFILFASHKANSDLLSEESKKIVLQTKTKVYKSNDFHCDLTLLPQQKKLMYFAARSDARADLSYDLFRWPKNKNGHVIVPYAISRTSPFSSDHLRLIRDSMDAIELVSCIRFTPRKNSKDFLNIFSGKHCKSNLGRTGGGQPLSLNWRICFEKGIIIHELLHALGYIHMHNRPDRDKYVKILWKNIDPNWFNEFNRVDPSNFNHLGTPYDYQSIMHYGATAFTKNGAVTIRTNEPIGQRYGLSEGDIRRINNKYSCKTNTPPFFPKPEYHLKPDGGKLFSKPYITTFTTDDDELFKI